MFSLFLSFSFLFLATSFFLLGCLLALVVVLCFVVLFAADDEKSLG